MNLPIVTSRSAVACHLGCARKRFWTYEAPNGTPTHGWERRRLALPLVTGIYVHEGLAQALQGIPPHDAAMQAKGAYLDEVMARGLAVEEGTDEHAVVEEQAHHVEALVLAWCRVRLPKWLDEYEIVEVESEDRVALADDVVLAVRADMVVRRKYDRKLFVVNFKTVAQADDRWMKSWEVDMQLMTELLAAERRHGQEFGGVIIEGLIKGRRMPEKNAVGDVTGYRDTTPLLYGYKVDANPPLTIGEYGWEYTRRKGWYRFPAWREQFAQGQGLNYWINWLPDEVVEAQFVLVPPIMREPDRIQHCVNQIVALERRVREGVYMANEEMDLDTALDTYFPQNTNECHWPSRCQCYDLCFTHGVADDPGASGLYQPRVDHHAPVKEIE